MTFLLWVAWTKLDLVNFLVSWVPAFQELWNVWEIHCLILISLGLQVFLFLFAGLRRRSASPLLHTVLWLAYLSADIVAIFVLGHLAVHASRPGHQLMSFWAPFVLVHLGGQDNITALSRQDNDMWKRHLLSMVSQVAVAGYVVAMASWLDGRLTAAMVIMFLSGCIKYAERTLCLYLASQGKLRSRAMGGLSETLKKLQDMTDNVYPFGLGSRNKSRARKMRERLDNVLEGSSRRLLLVDASTRDILTADAPLNSARIVSYAEDHLPGMLVTFQSSSHRCNVYDQVGAVLVQFYQDLYTKNPLLRKHFVSSSFSFITRCVCHCHQQPGTAVLCCALCCMSQAPFLLYDLFRYVSAPIALVLFWAAEKGDPDQLHSSRAVIGVSYTLLVAAIVLDVSSIVIFIFYKYIQLPGAWSKKQWSEELGQYSMIKRHVVKDTAGMASIRQWIGRRLGAWGVDLLELTHTPIAADHTPIKEFVLDNLLAFGIRKKWNIASSRGRLALEEWMDKHGGPDSERLRKALLNNISNDDVDFPTSVLIWHIATDICYSFGDNASTDSDNMKKHRQMSRELSNYIMYLVFKCSVMFTTNSQYVHEKAHDEISTLLSGQDTQGQQQVTLHEKAAVMKLFQAKKNEEQQDQSAVDIKKHQEPANNNNAADSDRLQQKHLQSIQGFDSPKRAALMQLFKGKKKEEQQDQSMLADTDNAAGSHLQKLSQSAKDLYSPVLPRACEAAQELISISDEIERWVLISTVWLEMLFFTAPRCGAAFHYEHLSTGGEFITHVLVLMKTLGPFLPPPGA